MPIITAVKPQKNQKRVNIYLDDKFGFGLDLENYLKLHLKVGLELSDDKVNEIIKKSEFQKSLDKLLGFATLRPRSTREIEDYLRRKKVHQSIHDSLFNRLKRLELVNDLNFARWWVGQRLQFKSKSKKDISFELRKKGVAKDLIDKVFSETKIDEKKNAKDLIEKKKYKWEKYDKTTRKQKMIQYLSGKGFGWDVIESVIN